MKVLHVYKDFYPPIAGGIERHVGLMCRFQQTEADVLALVCARRPMGRVRIVDGVPVREAGEWGRFQGAPLSPSFPLHLRRANPDVAIMHSPNPTAEISALVMPPKRTVVRYHSDVVRQARSMRFYAPVLRRFLRRADAIIASTSNYVDTSPYLREVRQHCHVIPLGIVPETYDQPSGSAIESLRERYGGPYVFACGRHVYYKGLEHLVEASTQVSAKVVVGGEGPLTPALKLLARRLRANVEFTGVLAERALIDHLHACSVFAFPSCERSEAFGIAMLEAQACAKPVVATRLGTGVEYVNLDGQTGLNVAPRDAAALAEALNRLLQNKAMAAEFGDAGRERVRREFDVRTVARRELELYRSLL